MTVTFAPATDAPGLVITDTVERRQFRLGTPAPVDVGPADPDAFRFPVDEAVSLPTGTVTLPRFVATYVRDDAGTLRSEIDEFGTHEVPEGGEYSVELSAPLKLYLRVEGPVTVEADGEGVAIRTGGDAVRVGARSHHDRPAATVTTTDRPRDLMRAVTALGSALKTVSPERSYPTLRGHPPALELGESLSVPEGLEPPETGIRLELPPERRYVYPAATLSYYLGAEVRPGPTPRLVADGVDYPLEPDADYEDEVARVLKRVFLLDCVTRTEGLYRVDLHERRSVEERVDLDFPALYGADPAERLAAYLAVPHGRVAPEIPEWKLTCHVPPDGGNAELLPFLVDDLAVIRTPRGGDATAADPRVEAVEAFTRADGGTGGFTRSAAAADSPPVVRPAETDSLEQAWAGTDAPLGASKVSVEAFRNGLDRDPVAGDIEITVVCNDDEMGEEGDLAAETYGGRGGLPFDVQVYRDLSTAALRAVLGTDTDLLHYIGHIDTGGFECTDGKLDVRELEGVGVDAFFLNACASYEQGMAMIERGAVGGVVTLTEVLNSAAVRVGRTMARLLDDGFPLRAALNIARDRSVVGGHYIVVGDGNLEVAQAEGGAPVYVEAERADGGFDVTVHAYPTDIWGMGSMSTILEACSEGYFLTSGELDTVHLSTDGLLEFFEHGFFELGFPVTIDGEFRWSGNVSAEDL